MCKSFFLRNGDEWLDLGKRFRKGSWRMEEEGKRIWGLGGCTFLRICKISDAMVEEREKWMEKGVGS